MDDRQNQASGRALTDAVIANLLETINAERQSGPQARRMRPFGATVLSRFADDLSPATAAFCERANHPADVAKLLARLDASIDSMCTDLGDLRRMIRQAYGVTQEHQRANDAEASLRDIQTFVRTELLDPANHGRRLRGRPISPRLRNTIICLAEVWQVWAERDPTVTQNPYYGGATRYGRFVSFVQAFLSAIAPEPKHRWDSVGASIENVVREAMRDGILRSIRDKSAASSN